LGLDSPQGMIVSGVTAGFPAEKAGIRMGDVILKINGSEVRDLSSIAANGSGPQIVPVEILSRGARRVVQLAIVQGQR
jgi:serine protease Do